MSSTKMRDKRGGNQGSKSQHQRLQLLMLFHRLTGSSKEQAGYIMRDGTTPPVMQL